MDFDGAKERGAFGYYGLFAIKNICFTCKQTLPTKPGKPHKCFSKCKVKDCNVYETRVLYRGRKRFPCQKHKCVVKKCTNAKRNGRYCEPHRNKQRRKYCVCMVCAKLPFDFVFLRIMYKRQIIPRDIYLMIARWLKMVYVEHAIRLTIEKKPYHMNYKTGNSFPDCKRRSLATIMCQKHFDQIEIPGPLNRYPVKIHPLCENCQTKIKRKESC
jgi:hypothetical protein